MCFLTHIGRRWAQLFTLCEQPQISNGWQERITELMTFASWLHNAKPRLNAEWRQLERHRHRPTCSFKCLSRNAPKVLQFQVRANVMMENCREKFLRFIDWLKAEKDLYSSSLQKARSGSVIEFLSCNRSWFMLFWLFSVKFNTDTYLYFQLEY